MKLIRLFLSLILFFVASLFVSIPNALANYSPDFTVSNVEFNPATNHLEFDYSGAPFTDSQIFAFDLRNIDADSTHLWWRTTGGSTVICSSNHCDGFLTSGGHNGQGLNLSYPSPYPLESQEMVIGVTVVGTGTEYFSSSFTYSSTGGFVCITTNPSPTPTPASIYSSDFTATNIVLNPSTYELSFDFSGAPFTTSQIVSYDLRNIDAETTGLWWRYTNPASVVCSDNHCNGFLTNYNGSYPFYPPDSQDMVLLVYAPDSGTDYYASQSFKFGSIWEGGACFVPEPVTLTFDSSSDTNVRSGQGNHNYGGLNFMRLQSSGDNRGLVRFDQSALQASINGEVLSAKLRVTITDNGNNWGAGRTVDVHRLISDWLEGNGVENDRGEGNGATWNCAIDSLIENQAKNCTGITEWEMGQPNNPNVHPWNATATDSETITNNQSGVVEYDVTADVQSYVNGTNSNYGWLIKKTNEGQNGQVSFGTRESSSIPQLVVTYQLGN